MPNVYEYDQNNSGGSFESPALKVFIEANSASEADERAQDIYGIYFDGVARGICCDCCGDRWDKADDPVDVHKRLTSLCEYFREFGSGGMYERWSKEAGCFIVILHTDGQEERLSIEDVYNYLPQGGSNETSTIL